MTVFFNVIAIVYLLAVNFFGFLLIAGQKRAEEEGEECAVKDGKVFFTGVIGGALGIYIAMFVYKYRLTSLALMVFMPVFIAATVFAAVALFTYGFSFAARPVGLRDHSVLSSLFER